MMQVVNLQPAMTAEQFCFWLQGFVELKEHEHDKSVTLKQWDDIKRHLSMVFAHAVHPPLPYADPNKMPATATDKAARTFKPLDFPRRDLDKILVC